MSSPSRRSLAQELASGYSALRQLARAARARPDLADLVAFARTEGMAAVANTRRALILPEVPYV
ncbi:hypothetical protein [uncultured Thiodictyon sp.]|uniref:hypothetical protein n=1 Tax=uncultured Thiodictyon sp. TaxID=1846217 RepID=UPI0025E676CC|nr:hypothetical protein [uncultured Thiodictyon sp.]